MKRATIALMLCLSVAGVAGAANEPCSQSKGGINRCESGKFICNDGSVSASKRICGAGDVPKPKPEKPAPSKDKTKEKK